jgi:hypothetical protein
MPFTLGILQDRHLEHVPGTATLADLNPVAALQGQAHSKELKKSGNGTILVPQPSDDPNGMLRDTYTVKQTTIHSNTDTPLIKTPSTIPSGAAT